MTPATLPTMRLGTSDLQITPVGFGAWAIGGNRGAFGWGPQRDNESLAAMRRALERGINWIDTAASYGLGHSEKIVGRLLSGIPTDEQPYVFTKCGLISDSNNPNALPQRSLRPESIKKECEASLRRLGIERIDLYQFHWPDDTGTPVEDSWTTMVRLVDEGKVRAIGVSNFNVALLDRCEAIRHVDSLQPPLSLIHRGALEREIPWCGAHEAAVICYSPMQSGILTDTFGFERVTRFAPDDWRRQWPDFQSPNLERNIALRDALRPVAERHGVSVSAVAIAWVIGCPGVTGAIVGARSPGQVDGWIDAATLELTDADIEEIAVAIERTGAGEGPSHPARRRRSMEMRARSVADG